MPRRHLNIPQKISIHKAGQHNWLIYDLFTPLERLTEDIIQSCQSNWLFTWKLNTMQPITEPADLRMRPSKAFSPKWPLQDCQLRCYCVKIKLLSESCAGRERNRIKGTGESVHIHVAISRVTWFQLNAISSHCPPLAHCWSQTLTMFMA